MQSMTQIAQEYATLLHSSIPDEKKQDIEAITKERGVCLHMLLDRLNLGDVYHTKRLQKIDDVFKRYEECMVWLQKEYARRPLEHALDMQVDPLIEHEHDYAIQSLMRKEILQKGALEIVHEEQDPFNEATGDAYVRLDAKHLSMIIEILKERSAPIALTLDNLSITDEDIKPLLPAIQMGKISSLSLQNSSISTTILNDIAKKCIVNRF
ncbi:MAG: hypothetical protein JSR46_07380 [Verrucomicrobia bacterium]|nr:hypothetical protein [Verrucomicrobiota bacterium]